MPDITGVAYPDDEVDICEDCGMHWKACVCDQTDEMNEDCWYCGELRRFCRCAE